MGMQPLEPNDFERFPLTWEYLREHEEALRHRERGAMDHAEWYVFSRTQSLGHHDSAKLGVPRLCEHLRASADPDGLVYLDNVDVNGILTLDDGPSLDTLLVLLNSRALDFAFQRFSVPFRGAYLSANKQFIAPLPVRVPEPPEARQIEELGRRLRQAALDIGLERKGFLDWLSDTVGAPWRGLRGHSSLGAFERLSSGDVLEILRRNRAGLSRSPDARDFRDELDRTLNASRERLAELHSVVVNDRQAADRLVYELYQLTTDQRTKIESEYEAAA